MPDPSRSETTGWQTRRERLAEADDDVWDSLCEAFDADWKAIYSTRFVAFAISRKWPREDAESWPDNIADDALIEGAPTHDWCPARTAEADVVELEMVCANA